LQRRHHVTARRSKVDGSAHDESLRLAELIHDAVQAILDIALAHFGALPTGRAGFNLHVGKGNDLGLHPFLANHFRAFLHELCRVPFQLWAPAD